KHGGVVVLTNPHHLVSEGDGAHAAVPDGDLLHRGPVDDLDAGRVSFGGHGRVPTDEVTPGIGVGGRGLEHRQRTGGLVHPSDYPLLVLDQLAAVAPLLDEHVPETGGGENGPTG